MPTATDKTNLEERFWAKVRKTPGCWLYPGSPNRDGYTRMRIQGKLRKASHVAWEIQVGAIPARMDILHTCDNRACIRRKHLFLGTTQDNTADMVKKKRHAYGRRNGRAKLDEAKVIEIRRRVEAGEDRVTLASEFGVNPSRIHELVSFKTWRHVNA